MDTRLIRANIALFEGDRLELQRLLEDYRHDEGEINAGVLWLEAQAQNDHESLVERLEKLLRHTQPNDPYHRMARDYLRQEDEYTAQIAETIRQSRAIPGVSRRRVIITTMLISAFIGLIVVGLSAFRAARAVEVVPPTAIVQATAQPTLLPDKSIRVNINDYTGRYEAGLLQVASIEDESQRVVDTLSGDLLSPVPGARFYALEVYFECRLGLCTEPPQADLTLALNNDFVVEPHDGATVQNGTTMTSIALGRRTVGWIIFEVPIISEAQELVITPQDRRSRNLPVAIPLPSLESR